MKTLKKNFRTLFVGGRDGYSLGRVAFWLVFLLAIYKWSVAGQDIPHGHLVVLLTFVGYMLGGKVVNKIGPNNTVSLEQKDSNK